jgi:hypothetical protein
MSRQHARIDKVAINLDHGGSKHVMCAWDTCEADGFETNKVVINYGNAIETKLVTHLFCTERHRQYFIHGSREQAAYGRLPPGFRRSTV